MSSVRGGRTIYGQALGVLMLDTRFPRLPGDVGNATTWPFPVEYRVVRGAVSSRIMGKDPDPDLLEPFVRAAHELQAHGVRAITTSCGFLAVFQRELANAVSVPVFTSALLQVPQVARMLGRDQLIGILTERPNLTERHFQGVGWSADEQPVVVRAMPPEAIFPSVFIDDAEIAEPAILEREMIALAEGLVQDYPRTGAFVMECTNFVPFSQAVREATGLPVFDLYTLAMQVYFSTVGAQFHGWL
jgi:hypothetical protein